MKKLPIGIQTFSEIIEDNHCYVDKTPLIHKLVNEGKYYFLSRPRRFGKSLLISTIKSAFLGQQSLFKNLYLEKNWDWSIQHPVLQISFGGGVVKDRENLDIMFEDILRDIQQQHKITLHNKSIQGRFAELIREIHQKYQQKVVILVDEYDKPILDNITHPELATEIRESLKNIYSVIKDNDEHTRFIFLTGVSKFNKVSLFSGLNNLTDITLNKHYATICGYTEADIKKIFKDYIKDVDFKKLRQWYNGYNFLGEKIYNPYDILLYLNSGEYSNYWFETGSPSFLIKLIQQKQYNSFDIDHVETSQEMLSSFDIEQIQLETLLFQTGYLTIDSVERIGNENFYKLRYPNHEVKSSLNNHILNYLTDNPIAKAKNQQLLYHAMKGIHLDELKNIFQAFFSSIPHQWYRKNQLANYEGYYASIFYCYFTALGLDTIAEDTTNHGQIDLTVMLKKQVFIIEFKVVNKNSPENTAIQQIKNNGYAEKYRQHPVVYLIGIEFNHNERNITQFDWEKA
ncbi:MAG: ATP-binding protein [Methylococcales bacterium]|nr:ATP-binding protein [Methylococcales bacterium]